MLIESCPCCGNRLLRHAKRTGAYLRCTSCWLEIPNLVETQDEGMVETSDFQLEQPEANDVIRTASKV